MASGKELGQSPSVAPLVFLEMEFEIPLHAMKFFQAVFCTSPESLHAADRNRLFRKEPCFRGNTFTLASFGSIVGP